MSKGCVIRACVFNRAAPGANTDILASNITPLEGGAFHITVSLSTGSVFNVTIDDGTDEHVIALNAGAALTANQMYTFTIGVNRVETNSGNSTALLYNFQVATNGVIEYLCVEEAQLGATG